MVFVVVMVSDVGMLVVDANDCAIETILDVINVDDVFDPNCVLAKQTATAHWQKLAALLKHTAVPRMLQLVQFLAQTALTSICKTVLPDTSKRLRDVKLIKPESIEPVKLLPESVSACRRDV